MIEQPNSLAVNQREQVEINIGLGLLGWFKMNAALHKLLGRPSTAIPVTIASRTAVLPHDRGKLLDHSLWREWWSSFSDGVQDFCFALLVGDCQRHRVRPAAARINKRNIVMFKFRCPLSHPGINASLDCFLG